MWNEKSKAITFSYDDGVTQDIRLIELFNKYGLKATFNLNSQKFGRRSDTIREGVAITHYKVEEADVRSISAGHEIAAHTLTHPTLTKLDDDAEIIRQVEEDRLRLSELAGYEVVGFAYPGGGINHSPHVAELIRNHTGVGNRLGDVFEQLQHLVARLHVEFLRVELHTLGGSQGLLRLNTKEYVVRLPVLFANVMHVVGGY